MELQDVFDRIEVAADVAQNARVRFVQAEHHSDGETESSAPIQRIKTNSQRTLLLQLRTRMIVKVCSIELDIDIKRQAPSVDSHDLPDNAQAAAELVERFGADAEEAFTELITRLGQTIAADSTLFRLHERPTRTLRPNRPRLLEAGVFHRHQCRRVQVDLR